MSRSTNHTPGAKGRRPLPVPLLLVGLAALSFMMPVRPDKERLADRLISLLREGRFEQLYEESGGNVRAGVSREKFVRRMGAAVGKLRAIDPGLNFRQDAAVEYMFASYGLDLITAARRLEGDGKSVTLLLHWTPEGEFSNLNVTPGRGTPDEFGVYGVTNQFDPADGRPLED